MRAYRTLVCLVVVMAALAAAATASASKHPRVLKQCALMPYGDIADAIGPLRSKVASWMPIPNSPKGDWWICQAQSERYFVTLGAFCHNPPFVAKLFMGEYASKKHYGEGGLTWRFLKGLGDQVVLARSPEPATGGITSALLIRKGAEVFEVVGGDRKRPMTTTMLKKLVVKMGLDCP